MGMTDGRNRHVADRLADVRSQLKELEEEEASLRSYLLHHPDELVGHEHEAIIYQQRHRRLDLDGLKREVGAEIVRRHTASRPVTFVRVKSSLYRRLEHARRCRQAGPESSASGPASCISSTMQSRDHDRAG
jgi:hypothetical protein